ncbi:helix-turn-helix protein, partial [Haemophilus influenzae]
TLRKMISLLEKVK